MAGKRGRPAQDRNKVRVELARRALEANQDDIASGRFADLSIEQLTRKSGISRSKFYVYFQDKEDLVGAFFTGVWASVFETQRAWWALDETADKDDLRSALAAIVEAYGPDRRLMAAVYDHALHSAVVRREVDRVIKENAARLAKHIRDGQRQGFVAPELAPAETAAWLTWMAERTLHALGPDEPLDRHIDTYTEIIWNTLYA